MSRRAALHATAPGSDGASNQPQPRPTSAAHPGCCSVPLLSAGPPVALSLEQRCCAVDTWFDVTMGVVLPLAVLSFLERRGREQRQEAAHWLTEDPRCPPRPEPAVLLLFSCVTFAAASLAALVLLPARGLA